MMVAIESRSKDALHWTWREGPGVYWAKSVLLAPVISLKGFLKEKDNRWYILVGAKT